MKDGLTQIFVDSSITHLVIITCVTVAMIVGNPAIACSDSCITYDKIHITIFTCSAVNVASLTNIRVL
jgi:hypothetical protein